MECDPRFSNVTSAYLSRFGEILDTMIDAMTAAPLTESISHNFIVQMIPHHQAAIEMSDNILQYTTDIPLQQIAQTIITEQTKSIENMQSLLARCAQQSNSEANLRRYEGRFRQITQMMFAQMRCSCADNNINANFMREMIPHHRGAVRMSENALQYPICAQLKPIVQTIIQSQERGIRQMQCLLARICR